MQSVCLPDCLLQDHPYRFICDLRKGASDSLVELDMTQHPADAPRAERVPDGLPFCAIKASMRELNVRPSVLWVSCVRACHHRMLAYALHAMLQTGPVVDDASTALPCNVAKMSVHCWPAGSHSTAGSFCMAARA